MLFEEDVTLGPERFKRRLHHIRVNPPIRKGADYKFVHRANELAQFERALKITARKAVAPSDLQKLRIIEDKVSRETLKEAPTGQTARITYTGHPGTGKTFRLLQIGMAHALAGRRVLYACFNKVLAADIRRMLSHSTKLPESRGRLDTVDVFDILRSYAEEYRLTITDQDHDIWGALIAEEMRRKREELEKYDTILIDEAQDMKDWALEMLELHAEETTSMCVAAGAGQELYGESGAWLAGFRSGWTVRQLRRNFRNTKPVFQAAQVFYEARMRPDKAAATIRRFGEKKLKDDQQPVLFERAEGRPPSVTFLNEDALEGMRETDPWYASEQAACMVSEYTRIIRDQLDRLAGEERPIDLLVLVPTRDGMEREWAVRALDRLKVAFIDYTDEARRRDIAHPEMVRLCTFHSARGLEGMRVVVFGFERIERMAERVKVDFANLGYIVLSRSLFECVIAVRKSSNSPVVPFLISVLDQLSV